MHDYDWLLEQMIASRYAAQEQVAEASIQTGTYGMATIHDGLTLTARVDPRVPYGNHFIFPTPDAYDRWVENGCPL